VPRAVTHLPEGSTPIDYRATTGDIRLIGLLLDAIKQRWAGALGGPPTPGSPLARDLAEASRFATRRLPDPVSQAWTVSQTLGLVATNHEMILRESLLNYANAPVIETLPITVVTTMARVVLEALSIQAWLIDPSSDGRERFARWMCLEFQSEREAWKTLHPGTGYMSSPIIQQLIADAEALGIDRGRGASPKWIGAPHPTSTDLTGDLLRKYPTYSTTGAREMGSIGERFYRLFSSEIHGTVGSVLLLLLPSSDAAGESRVHVYNLSHGALWRAAAMVLMSTFVARCVYAEWLGFPIDPETRRVHQHHIELAGRKLLRLGIIPT
jgi:hypothetical protein